MTSQYKRALVMQYLRYTFTTGVLLVFVSLLNFAVVCFGFFWYTQRYASATCVAVLYAVIVLLHMLIQLFRFKAYKQNNNY